MMLIQTIPAKKMSWTNLFSSFVLFILPNLNSKYPMSKFNNAHKTFVRGKESPLPGGSAKGVGKELPEMPFTKCGTALARNIPAKKAAM